MDRPAHVTPEEVRTRLEAGEDALLVCAYDSDDKWRDNLLEGSIPLSDLESRLAALSRDARIVFYCA